MELKRDIFYMYELARILFNDFYNGHADKFTNEELKRIEKILKELGTLKKDTIEEVNHQKNINGLLF